jgi:hypothetical protein
MVVRSNCKMPLSFGSLIGSDSRQRHLVRLLVRLVEGFASRSRCIAFAIFVGRSQASRRPYCRSRRTSPVRLRARPPHCLLNPATRHQPKTDCWPGPKWLHPSSPSSPWSGTHPPVSRTLQPWPEWVPPVALHSLGPPPLASWCVCEWHSSS